MTGSDAEQAEKLLAAAQAQGVAVLAEITRKAVKRVLRNSGTIEGISELYTEEERQQLADQLRDTVATAELLGRARIKLRAEQAKEFHEQKQGGSFAERPTRMDVFAEPIKPLSPEAAIDYFRRLVPGLEVSAAALAGRLIPQAFTLAVSTESVVLDKVKSAIQSRLETGQDVRGGAKEIQAILDEAGVSPANPQYAEAVLRTNMMESYNQGAQEELTANAEVFPVWKYSNPNDGRSRPHHAANNGKYFPTSTLFEDVRGHGPENAINCRCVPIPVDKWEALDLAKAGKLPPGVLPAELRKAPPPEPKTREPEPQPEAPKPAPLPTAVKPVKPAPLPVSQAAIDEAAFGLQAAETDGLGWNGKAFQAMKQGMPNLTEEQYAQLMTKLVDDGAIQGFVVNEQREIRPEDHGLSFGPMDPDNLDPTTGKPKRKWDAYRVKDPAKLAGGIEEFVKRGQAVKPVSFDGDKAGAIEYAKKVHGAWGQSLTPDQQKTLEQYSRSLHVGLNRYLREGRPLPATYAKFVDDIDRAIDAAPPLPEPMILHRGIGGERLLELQPGEMFEDGAFLSTTSNKDVSRGFVYKGSVEIRVPAGTKAAAMDANPGSVYLDEDSENEYLLPRGSRFRVLSVGENEVGKPHLVVEMLPPDRGTQAPAKAPKKKKPEEKPPAEPVKPREAKAPVYTSEADRASFKATMEAYKPAFDVKALAANHDAAQAARKKAKEAKDEMARISSEFVKLAPEERGAGNPKAEELDAKYLAAKAELERQDSEARRLNREAKKAALAALELPEERRARVIMTEGSDERLKPTPKVKEAAADAEAFLNKVLARDVTTSPVLGKQKGVHVTLARVPDSQEQRDYAVGSTIHLSTTTNPAIAVHEIGHVLENLNPNIHKAAVAFLEERCGDEPLVDMGQKFPEQGYKQFEMGRKDKFDSVFDEDKAYYVGKDYSNQNTEVVSMGLEKMFDDPAGFAAKDPEYFRFISAILDGTIR